MIKEVYNSTDITEDFEKTFELESWRKNPGAVQISWNNLEGTNDGIITVSTRLSSSHNYATLETINMSSETDNTAYVTLDIYTENVKVAYTANSITSVDMVITKAD